MGRRWEPFETVAKVYRPDLYLQAARLLVKEGKAEGFPLGQRRLPRTASEVHRRRRVRRHRPNEYLAQFAIGLKSGQRIENGRLVTSGP